MRNLSVLIVDDGEDMLELLTLLLEEEYPDIKIQSANNGFEALNEMRKNRYHVLITDYDMPVMNGLELVNSLKSLPKTHLPPGVIVLSAYIEPGEPEENHSNVTFMMKEDYKNSLLEYFSNELYMANYVEVEEVEEVKENITEDKEYIRVDLISEDVTVMSRLRELSIEGLSVYLQDKDSEFSVGKNFDAIFDLKNYGSIKISVKVIHRGVDSRGNYLGLYFQNVNLENEAVIKKYLEN